MAGMLITIADTMLGYGSPQILSVTRSLADYHGCDHVIYQPFVPHRKYVDLSDKGYKVETISSIEHPWSWIGRMQYLRRVAIQINSYKPEILILTNYNLFQILDLLTYKPKKIIHLALEDMEQFGSSILAMQILRKIRKNASSIDVWIFPDQHRAMTDCQTLNIPYNKVVIFYNIIKEVLDTYSEFDKNDKIIYAGSVDFNRTAARYFSNPKVYCNKVDVYGRLEGSVQQINEFMSAVHHKRSQIEYYGEIPAVDLAERLPQYSYSLVYWFPVSWATRNAAPNKFYQAIAMGVPVITAPHPQCSALVKRYNCGVVLKDWELNTFILGVEKALDMLGTPQYNEMLYGCRKAIDSELNWEIQFKKLLKIINRK